MPKPASTALLALGCGMSWAEPEGNSLHSSDWEGGIKVKGSWMRARISGLASFLSLLKTTLELYLGLLLEWSWCQESIVLEVHGGKTK